MVNAAANGSVSFPPEISASWKIPPAGAFSISSTIRTMAPVALSIPAFVYMLFPSLVACGPRGPTRPTPIHGAGFAGVSPAHQGSSLKLCSDRDRLELGLLGERVTEDPIGSPLGLCRRVHDQLGIFAEALRPALDVGL